MDVLTRTSRSPAAARGWILMDVVGALALLAAIIGMLVFAASQWRRGHTTLADRRTATRAAEAALIELQQRRPPTLPEPALETALRIAPLPTAEGAEAGDNVWVRVTATRGAQTVVLVGLAPRDAVAQAAPTPPAPEDPPPPQRSVP